MKFILVALVFLSSVSLAKDTPLIFGVRSKNKSINTSYDVVLKKIALDKPFLFSVSKAYSLPVGTGSSLKSKVIFFKKRKNKLYMFENTEGQMVSTSIKTKVLLASFPIISENSNQFVINFSEGMSSLLVKGGMHGPDYSDYDDSEIKVDDTFVEKVEQKENQTFIDQYIRVSNETFRMKFVIGPYSPDKNFNPKKSNDNKSVGYFETHPVLDPSATTSEKAKTRYILKFDENKPITYFISSNVPEEYKKAVEDGVLYWNKVFKKEFIKVATLPKGVTPHDPGYNIVQWLDWPTAGFAYANIQADPLTGQTINSTVYMTSSFAFGSIEQAKELLLRLSINKKKSKEGQKFGLKGFEENHLCSLHQSDYLVNGISQTLNEVMELPKEKQEEIIHRISSDHIAAVMAHEVGHTLGLRHNFAGTLTTTIEKSEWSDLLDRYILNDEVLEEKTVSSSIMDYTALLVSTLNGARMRKDLSPLSYDSAAINWGYSKKNINDFDFPLFCTDSNVDEYKDCQRWDQFKNPFEGASYSLEQTFHLAPFYVFQRFLNLTEKKEEEPLVWEYLTSEERMRKIEEVSLSPEAYANYIAKRIKTLVELASEKGDFLSVKNNFPYVNDFNNDEYKKIRNEFIKKGLSKAGGLVRNMINPFYLQVEDQFLFSFNFLENFNMYLEQYSSKFEEGEFLKIKKLAEDFSLQLEKELLIKVSEILKGASFANYENSFEVTYFDWIKKILFKKDEKNILFDDFSEYKFQYTNIKDKDLRSSFISLLKEDIFKNNPSYTRRKNNFSNDLYSEFKKTFDLLTNGNVNDLEDKKYDWVYKESERFLPLSPKRRPRDLFDML